MGRKQDRRSKFGVDSIVTGSPQHPHLKSSSGSKHKKDKEIVHMILDQKKNEMNSKKNKNKKGDLFANISNEKNEWKALNPNNRLPIPGDSIIVKKQDNTLSEKNENGEEEVAVDAEGTTFEEAKTKVVGIKGNLASYKIFCPSNPTYHNMSLKKVLESCHWKYRFSKIVEEEVKINLSQASNFSRQSSSIMIE